MAFGTISGSQSKPMNYKLLFPTYRNRYLFVKENLAAFGGVKKFEKALHLGTGEGDYDPMIAPFCEKLIACDLNRNDMVFAARLNAKLKNTSYTVENALDLSFEDNSFDLVVTVDVIEHVGQPARMMSEISRVLKPGGLAVITFPQRNFPWTYDPLNRLLSYFSTKKIPQGAYAFGHTYLIDSGEFKAWALKNNLEILAEKNLSAHLVALVEMYWTGLVQQIFKANAGNADRGKEKQWKLRPSTKEPALVKWTDFLIRLDNWFFKNSNYSVGKGFVVRKCPTP